MEIKQGMMALIINSPVNENLGRVVTVDHFIGEHTSATGTTKQNCWSVVVKGMPLKGYIEGSLQPRYYRRGIIPADWLMPIIEEDDQASINQACYGAGWRGV